VSRSRAVARATAATSAWQDAERAQRRAAVLHEDIYALAGEIVGSLYAVQGLVLVLRGQVAGYADTTRGAVYDDSRYDRRPVSPQVRLRDAARELTATGEALDEASVSMNAAWSAVGHIGVDDQHGHPTDHLFVPAVGGR
jgi:hypothetical protein